jgi:prolyl oligopeptidase
MSIPLHLRARAVALLACFAAATAGAQGKPPVAPAGTVTDTYFGTTVADPYRALEDAKNPDVAAWMKGQSDHTRSVLDRIPQRATLLAEVEKYGDGASARTSGVQVNGDHVYYYKRLANENIPKLYVRRGVRGNERLLVDPEALTGADGKHSAIDWFSPSPDNRYVAYGVSPGGSEQSVLHVKEVATGKETGDVIDRTNFGPPGWTTDGRLLYNRLQKLAPDAPPTAKYVNSRVFLHALGADPEQDVAVLGPGVAPGVAIDPATIPFAGTVPGSRWALGVIINGVQREATIYAATQASLAAGKPEWKKVVDTADEVTDSALIGNQLYLLSHKGAPRFKVLRIDLDAPDVAHAALVVPASDSVITGLVAAQDALYVRRMNGSTSDLVRVAYAPGAKPAAVPLPFAGDIASLAADVRVPGVIYEASAWTFFGGFYAYDPRTRKVADTRLQPQGPYDHPDDLVATEVKVPSHDGTLVPLSIVHRKGLRLDGSNPTIVYGYGAYGISQTPFYRPTWLPWFRRGGILAVAHVRGGGEYGEDWYKGGYKATKPNTWKDAIASAEWLIAHKYTATPRIAIMGGSAGGIFVGRSITERPDLFGAAIDEVPVSDGLRMELTENGVPNIPEFGSVATEEGFRSLYAMSSYHQVKDGVAYPAVLVTTGINDPRVDAWQAAKMAARLQKATSSGKPVLLRIDYDAGHGIGSTKKQAYEERADTLAFLFWQFGVTGFQPQP